MQGTEDQPMRQRESCLVIVVGTVVWLITGTGWEADAQRSKLLEFGPDTIELALPKRPAQAITLARLVEPAAGSWRPWVLASGRELRLPPPPDERSTRREQHELRKLAAGDDAEALGRVRHWDLGSPAHRWNEMLADLIVRDDIAGPAGIRAFALLNIAIDDALIAAWDSKYAYKRPRPSELDARLVPEVAVPRSPSYPCEHAVAAGAAAGILAHLFPRDAERLAALAHEAARSRVMAGAVYPSDSRAGLTLGQAVAARVIEHAMTDRVVLLGMGRSCADPARPVAVGHAGGVERALWSGGSAGDRHVKGDAEVSFHHPLNEEISRRLAGAALDGNAPRAARVYALTYVAAHAALFASGAETARDSMVPPDRSGAALIVAVSIPVPAARAPSGAVAGLAGALVLDHLLPSEVSRDRRGAREAGTGAGVARDVEARLDIARWVAAAVIERARCDGAE
jgi:hypothetical protein